MLHVMVLDGAWKNRLGLDQQSIAGPIQFSAIQISKELQTQFSPFPWIQIGYV
jgi:hypothetical protein